jgi:serine/threonine-protein kinase
VGADSNTTIGTPTLAVAMTSPDSTSSMNDLDATRSSPIFPPPLGAGSTNLPAIPGYEILGEIDSGGMGVVYRARHLLLDLPVALKMVRTGTVAGPEELARFHMEARAVAALTHLGVVRVYDFGEHRGQPFFSMELVEGGSLADRLRGGPLPAAEAARLIEGLARIVQHVHERGVIHRDLKPANILLTPDGQPKVADFGLARRMSQDSGLTWTGAVMGTASYMSPEQAAGKTKEIGPAADVYSLGAILYECLTGRPPFRAATRELTIL